MTKVVILAGGFGTRLSEYTKKIPKPMVMIKKKPILGICFGHQILSKFSGGKVKSSKQREFGLAQVLKKKEH